MNPIQLLQQSLKLTPDGVIGRITFGALRMHWNLTGIQLAHLLGQCEHETGGFRLWSENLNYSQAGLIKTFGRYYPLIDVIDEKFPELKQSLLAIKHQRKPSVIANHVYGGRMGNTQPNDGWHFRGRGGPMLTGRDNYTAFANWKKDQSILTHPDQVATVYAFDSLIWFFESNWIWKHTIDLSVDAITKVSKAINLGNANHSLQPNGLDDRIKKTLQYSPFL